MKTKMTIDANKNQVVVEIDIRPNQVTKLIVFDHKVISTDNLWAIEDLENYEDLAPILDQIKIAAFDSRVEHSTTRVIVDFLHTAWCG